MDSHSLGIRRPKGPQLSAADQRAVEMLLEQPNKSAATGGFASVTEPTDPARLEGVRRLLTLLDAYEVEDPPADLAARTLARISSAPKSSPQTGDADRPTTDA